MVIIEEKNREVETITRAFRKIMQEHNEEGLHDFLRYDPIDEERKYRAEEIREYFGGKN